MRVVYKYAVPLAGSPVKRDVPEGARFLEAVLQGSAFAVYYLVDPKAARTERVFTVVGTGEEVPTADDQWHLASLPTGRHLFVRAPEKAHAPPASQAVCGLASVARLARQAALGALWFVATGAALAAFVVAFGAAHR